MSMTTLISIDRSAQRELTQRRASRPECPSVFPGGPPFRAGEDLVVVLSEAGIRPENCPRPRRVVGKGGRS